MHSLLRSITPLHRRQYLAARASVLFCTLLSLPLGANEPSLDLFGATEAQNVRTVRQMLQQGIDVNVAQPDGTTALHWAVYHDDAETAGLLIDAGANPTAENRYAVRPLSLACRNGNAETIKRLLEAGADANTRLPGGETALMTAARTGKVDAVRLLLQHGADVDAEERHGQTALMWAAADGNAEVVKLLLAEGADFESPLPSGFTPLFFAVRNGHTAVVQVLLDAGADVNEAMEPKRSGRKAPRRGTTPLVLAVENGHFDLAATLLERGADPDDQRCGFTALHTLTWVRKPNRGDGDDGDPPPIGSGEMTDLDFVRKLVEHGGGVNVQLKRGSSGRGRLSQTGATPFFFAADTADLPLMQLLVELGADPMLPNADGATPLMAAAGLGTIAPGEEAGTEEEALLAVQYLLGLGAEVNAVDRNGETAMHGAAYKSLPKMVHLLVEEGADIDIWNRKNKYGWTPLRIARGYRPGNFKPSAATIGAIENVMRDAGVEIPREEGEAKQEDYE